MCCSLLHQLIYAAKLMSGHTGLLPNYLLSLVATSKWFNCEASRAVKFPVLHSVTLDLGTNSFFHKTKLI